MLPVNVGQCGIKGSEDEQTSGNRLPDLSFITPSITGSQLNDGHVSSVQEQLELSRHLSLSLCTHHCHPSTPRVKAVKRGFRSIRDPKVCGVSFESLPVWLWTLRPKDWSQIFITGPDEARLRQVHPKLLSTLENLLTIVSEPLSHDQRCCNADVWWISGREAYLSNLHLPSKVATVLWASFVGRRIPASLSGVGIEWTHINHSRIGGVTNARGWFGVKGLSPLSIPTDLDRTLAHVLKHSIRGLPCAATYEHLHYSLSDRLSVKHVTRPVVYPTHFSRTGWGQRMLEASELAMCFELPDFVEWDPKFATSLIPLQLFRVVIDTVLDQLMELSIPPGSAPITAKKRRLITLASDEGEPRDGIWLSQIQKWLPGTWADVAIADRAVKSDNAEVDLRPWHLRITLVLPCSPANLESLTQFVMRRWRLNVISSFFTYLSHRYGQHWQAVLFGALNCRVGDALQQERKRPLANNGSSTRPQGHPKVGGIGDSMRDESYPKLGEEFIRLPSLRDLVLDVKKGLVVLGQVIQSTWWDWSSGSSLFFWRWNGLEQLQASRDGMHIFIQSPLPRREKSNHLKFSADVRPLVATKIQAMIQKGYLEWGLVRTSLHYFAVPKGDSDIRVVYDGTSCGLNECLWSPNFFLPTAKSAALLLTFGTWMADMDFGEFFHNFPMTERIRQHSGVNIKPLAPFVNVSTKGEGGQALRWSRLFMGMKPSPYNSVRQYYWGEEFARGNPADENNPFGYDQVVLNLPGMDAYDPSVPKLMKWNSRLACMAGDVIAFVDDVRMTGSTKERCHQVHRQFTSRMQYLGFQDAPRKFRPPSQVNAGAWTGTIFCVGSNTITKTVTLEKWIKGCNVVKKLKNQCDSVDGGRPNLCRKELERVTGFLNHLSTTFDEMTPYLKGFYLTLNSWRPKRDDQDWKVSDKTWIQLLTVQLENDEITPEEFDAALDEKDGREAPGDVVASPRFSDDVKALSALFQSEDPPVVGITSKNIVTVVYGFGDASGTGLGATFTCGSGFTFRVGVWGSEEDDQSSNWKEFTNVVESLEEEAKLGNLNNSEVFMFTDNSTVEACAVRGSSSSPKLFDLILRLRCLSTGEHGLKLNIFHVSGTRMIAQGTDGVSRGFLGAGVMSGESMTSFIPLHVSASDRSQHLVPWVHSWVGPETKVVELSTKQWFDVGHDIEGWSRGWDGFEQPTLSKEGRVYLWCPPPFVADVAISELRKARIKRQKSTHIFICPRLCSALWIRQLYKAADIVLEIPAGKSFWDSEMHEPLLIGLVFPFIRCKPWQLRATPKMFSVAREVRGLCVGPDVDLRDFLLKFWRKCHRLGSMPADVVRRMLFLDSRS